MCVCEEETGTKAEGELEFALYISPLSPPNIINQPLWSLSASVLLSVHGGLGMDEWSRERGRQNEHSVGGGVKLKSTELSSDKLT